MAMGFVWAALTFPTIVETHSFNLGSLRSIFITMCNVPCTD